MVRSIHHDRENATTIVNNYMLVLHFVDLSRQCDHRFSKSLCVCVCFSIFLCVIIIEDFEKGLILVDHCQPCCNRSSQKKNMVNTVSSSIPLAHIWSEKKKKNMFPTYMSIFPIYFYKFTPKEIRCRGLRLCGAWGALAAPPAPPKPTVRLATQQGCVGR